MLDGGILGDYCFFLEAKLVFHSLMADCLHIDGKDERRPGESRHSASVYWSTFGRNTGVLPVVSTLIRARAYKAVGFRLQLLSSRKDVILNVRTCGHLYEDRPS